MLGAAAGDIIGSVYEFDTIKTKDFPLFSERSRFTDDSVLTMAVANAICRGVPYKRAIREIGNRYPESGYGSSFVLWLFGLMDDPYYSWGNGSAMRVSPVGFAFKSREKVLEEAERSAEITHDHPEGIKGARATALAVFFAAGGADKEEMEEEIEKEFGYDLDRTVADIRPDYQWEASCQKTVPEAIVCFLDSVSFEDAIRNAVSLGGDSDTLACIAGSIAEAYYREIPMDILIEVKRRLPGDLWEICREFYRDYGLPEVRAQVEALQGKR
ncbi:MAG: ADP-ribosylglycohydrolase family protein [Candidatus Latescibacteria bacterium]|nr:ADP-ribosylglycohydrolase family protein [bacterium]MBD3424201.1 ADP-ribosylglycohydrolase family protein [Candidatus Latescibacterota bacterium]